MLFTVKLVSVLLVLYVANEIGSIEQEKCRDAGAPKWLWHMWGLAVVIGVDIALLLMGLMVFWL